MERFVNANEVPVDDIKAIQDLHLENKNGIFNDTVIVGFSKCQYLLRGFKYRFELPPKTEKSSLAKSKNQS